MTLDDVRTDVFSNPMIASVYRDARFLEGKVFMDNIFPYPKRNITGVMIFINYDSLITGGQLSTYTPDEGMRGFYLDKNLHVCEEWL